MKIYRSQLLDIIANYRLVPGDFITEQGDERVCVIGALTRSLLGADAPRSDIYKFSMKLTKGKGSVHKPLLLARQGNLFGALSALFENITADNDDVVDESVRKELSWFVQNNFPEMVQVSYNA